MGCCRRWALEDGERASLALAAAWRLSRSRPAGYGRRRDFTITFCGGWHPQPEEDADVKVPDNRDGTVRILGRGSWWPDASSAQLARWIWWHAAGHENGRWVAADNWHGDIGIFHGKTTRTYILTRDHRTCGRGAHPEVGWDRRREQVVFGSRKLGNPDVCVAAFPARWQRQWDSQISHYRATPDALHAFNMCGLE